jgi:hypothetical protein
MRKRLTTFYRKYQPGKLAKVDFICDKYAHDEDGLFATLVEKYGTEPGSLLRSANVASRETEEDEVARKASAIQSRRNIK